ncbi:alpha-L-rhamnosidase C-terminal domain-containing protein [Synoicihabitans lomoniglobus]|uniref:Alpha-L-rhamnosidase C-terminal domain-containing protein n=1 Tax=Synoicihabitans lomoniglobus TaxID=2909285 RepID=A0AAF0CP00_9BACT|nr:hypothetical protein [Opitutaceae bacterium LMO-M01]WED63169.1 alpha-L-rhamnosidase C-terminal domain-containing protein [Opitutaceae bacterium LMO-M01]
MPVALSSSPAVAVDAFPPLHARFVWSDQTCNEDLTVHLFRRTFEVADLPASRRIIVTADSRYVLWLNGERLGRGPLKGTLEHYHAEVYELAGRLRAGRNVLAAEVRWFGRSCPRSEVHSSLPGWFVQGLEDDELDTPGAWRVCSDDSVTPGWDDPYSDAQNWLGPLDKVDLSRRPRGWAGLEFDDHNWTAGQAVGGSLAPNPWAESHTHQLQPCDIPLLSEQRRLLPDAWIDRQPATLPWTVPAGEAGELWLGAGALTTGYPVFEFAGGAGREVRVVYAEALGHWEERRGRKVWVKRGRRDDVAHLYPHGNRDVICLSGEGDVFEPFHWRTFWFIKIEIPVGDAAVTLRTAHHRFTTFPQSFTARFTCAEPDIAQLWDISLRTLQLCAHETYEDCPYFEQLNYTGDTRLQALCSRYLANDTRLGRRCLRLFRESLGADGLTGSRIPARGRQVIPAFSLHWILMLRDHWEWVGEDDREFVRGSLASVDAILLNFRDRLLDNGFVGRRRGWDWTDWAERRHHWHHGVSPAVAAGTGSTYLTALYVLALDAAAELHLATGITAESVRWIALSRELRATLATTWDEQHGYFIEGPGRESDPFSQQTQTFVILAGGASDSQLARIGARLVDDDTLVRASLVHRYYVAQALARLGRYDRFFPALLEPWREMRANGLTTWQEHADPSRSDCHAWSSWIVIAFFANVLGVQPAAPGWTAIRIEPQLDATDHAEGEINTPVGGVQVAWRVTGPNQVALTIEAPADVPVLVKLPGQAEKSFATGGSIHLTAHRQAS